MREPNEYRDSDLYLQEEKSVSDTSDPEITENFQTESIEN